MPWCFEDETTPASEEMLEWAMRGSELHVPAIWLWEIVNILSVAVKRQRITRARAKDFLAELATLNFYVASPPTITALPRLQDLAARHELTAYDVSYLDLAVRLSLPLATRDSDLRKAAVTEGIDLLAE